MSKYCENGMVLQVDQLGPYGLVKKLSEVYADQLSKSTSNRKKFLRNSFEVLLKKEKNTPEDLPSDWEDDDVLGAIKLEIWKRCKAKQTWTSDLCKNVIAKTEILHRNKETEYFKNCVSPALRMLLCIEYYQRKIPTVQKKADKFFNTDIISSYLDNIKSFLPKVETRLLTLPQSSRFPRSQSDGQLKYFPSNNRFDYIFQIGKQVNDLDEGFVTPNDDHIEKSPCLEPKHLPTITEANQEKFYWDFKVVSIPPSRNKTWEKYGTIGNLTKQRPFIQPNTVVKDWLRTAPVGITYVPRDHLLDDLLVLFVGIPTTTFVRNGSSFRLKGGIYTDDLTPDAVCALSQKFIQAGTGFIALMKVCESSSVRLGWEEDTISLAFKLALKEYLNKYQRLIISAKEQFSLEETSYFKLMTTLHPFIEQVEHLKTILIKEPELKGVTLLKYLFDLMGSISNTSIYRIISSLFLVPCIYYFKLIDEWIFLGKWHKDLLMSASDMSCVNDRKSWLEAHAATTNIPWLVPTHQLAHCGKAIYLLSLSKSYEKYLCLLKSEKRPKLKVCFTHEELSVLREDCAKYYDEAMKLFLVEKEEVIDSVLCAQNAALKYTEEFESKRLECKMRLAAKKKEELILRQEDLVRSSQNKELERLKEEAENVRVAKEFEEILYKEQQQEIEKSKVILERYQEQLELEEKRLRRAEWKIKRQALNEKRKEFLSNEHQKGIYILPPPLEYKNPPEEMEKNDNAKPVLVNFDGYSIETNEEFVSVECQEVEKIPETDDCNENKIQLNTDSVMEDLSEHTSTSNEMDQSIKVSEFERNRMKAFSSDFMMENVQDIVGPVEGEISELQKNKNKILGSFFENKEVTESHASAMKVHENVNNEETLSDFMNENVQGIVRFENKNEGETSELQMNKNKILGTYFDNKEVTVIQASSIKVGENVNKEEKFSDLEKNRMKILGSDLENDYGIRLHVWDEETQRNRKNMLDSHIPFAVEFEIEKANLKKNLQQKALNKDDENPNSKDSEKIAVDTQDCEDDKNSCVPAESVDMNYKKPTWFQPKSRENNKFKHVFMDRSSSFVPKKDVDFTFLNKFVPQSLRTVIDIQTKLVNEALLRMFLSEFELLKIAQKLRECFFLHGEFGKRLTSSLSQAIESEEPSTLLTFYRLRSILTNASRGDIKELSFVVNDTPVAFDHSNSKVLLCLGLTYKCEWPLNLIFTDRAISKYNDIFVYMFALQRVSWHLDKVCHMLRFKSSDLKGFQYTQIHLYRHVMSQFVGTLRSYIVTTVIENCWQEFIKDVLKLKDIDELYKRHANYIKDISFKCFLGERSKKIMTEIEKLLHFILVFCRTLFYGEWHIKENEYIHSNFEKLRSTFSSFLTNARFVTKFVQKLVKVNYQKDLENLNDFLTINSFYVS